MTLSGTASFQALDGSGDDHDGSVNGVFTVSDGDLVINGVVNCNDDSGRDNGCAMSFVASGDIVVNAGGALYAENRSGGGTGGAISLTAGRDLIVRGPSGALPAALVSSASRSSSGSTGGSITANVSRHASFEAGSTIDAGSANAKGGAVTVVAGGTISAGGNIFSGPSRTLLASRLDDGAALDGGSSNAGGGAITLRSTTFVEPAVVIGSNANVVSQGEQSAAGPVTIEGCGIQIRGLVAALSRKDTAAKIHIRSGKDILIDARDLGVAGATLGRNARVRADAPSGTAINKGIDIFAAETIEILGPARTASTLYTVTSLAGVHDAKSLGGLIRIISTGESVTASGNVIEDGRSHSGDTGGRIEVSSKGNLNLDTAAILSFGDSSTSNPARGGGQIVLRSYSGNVNWTNGFGDVRPTGSSSGLPVADQGTISATACGSVTLSGSSFPTNGPAVGPWPTIATGVCSPAAPSLPAGTPPLVTCNTPPVANDATGSTLEDTTVTITLSGSDADGDSLTFSIVSGPANGSLGPVISTGPTTATVDYTPNANYNGSDSFVFRANDGNGGTDDAVAAIGITPVNDAPSFLPGPTVSSLEDGPAQSYANWVTAISAGPADEAGQSVTFSVSNNNSSLFAVQPAIAANGTLTWTAAPNAYGTATITITAQDNGGTANGGVDTSAPQNGTITIVAVNDAPSFTAGGNVAVAEDSASYSASWASGISAGPNETQNLTFNVTAANSGLFSVQPAISAGGVLTFTLAANANGSSSVSVTLSDDGGTANGGVDTSAAASFTIDVTAVNDDPSFTAGGNVTVLEDSGAYSAAWATGVSAGPADENGQTLTFSVANDNNSLFAVQPSISSTGVLSFTVAANAFGSATVTVTLSDNAGGSSAAETFTINVTAVNDAPSFTAGGNVTVGEDSAAYSAAWATGISAGPGETQNLTFSVSNSDNSLFSAQPSISATGVLSFTLAANANGSATVTVSLSDDGGTANGGVDTSSSETFTVNVTAVNDDPSFTAGGNVTVLEDSGAYSAAWATGVSAGPADENGQTLSFSVTNDNNSLFSAQPAIAADGTLTFTLNANAFGSATVTVTLSDNAGGSSSSQTFTIDVTAVNDAPSFTAGGNVTVGEDSAAYSAAWANGISAGPGETQNLTFSVSNSDNSLFSAQPSISATGVLSFTLAANANGSATVTVSLSDDGGTANGGVDTSSSETFTITVNAVNDDPSFTGGGDVTVQEDSGAWSAAWASDLSAGPADENGQTLSFSVTNDNNSLFSAQPAIAADGTLTFTLNANAFGSATVTVTLSDDAGGSSSSQTFTINVTAINDAPSFTAGGDVTVGEDSAAYSAAWANAISAGPGETQNLTFSVANSDSSLFSVQPSISSTGVLTFTPAANANGVVTVTVTLSDDGGTAGGGVDTSASVTFTLTVNAVNDTPSFVKGADQTVAEDTGAVTVPNWAGSISAGPADEAGQALTFTVTAANPSLFSVQPAVSSNGTLTFTTAPNVSGSTSVTITLSDDGGATSAAQSFTITVTAVNDPPSFTAGGNVTLDENTGLYSAQWATNISQGDGESGQTLTFTVTNDNNALFVVQPAISASGVLTFTLAPNSPGVANVTVTLSDGIDSTSPVSFAITVNDVNNAPIANNDAYDAVGNTILQVAPTKTVTGPAVHVAGNLFSNDTDADGPLPLSASFVSGSAGATIVVNSDGSFTYVPPAGFTGSTDSFVYAVTDGVASATGTVTITVKGLVWYVKNDVVVNGNGRSNTPFNTLAQAETASGATDTVYVFFGNGTTAGQSSGFTLGNSERLIGAGTSLQVAVSVNGGPNPTLLANPDTHPLIGNSAGDGVTIAGVSNVEVAGVNVAGTANGVWMTGNGIVANVHDNIVRGAALSGIAASVSGSSSLTVNSNNVTSTGTAILLGGATTASSVAAQGNTVKSAAGHGIQIDSMTVRGFGHNTVSGDTAGNGIRATSVIFDAVPGGSFNTVAGGNTTVGNAGNGVGSAGIVIALSKGDLAFSNLNVHTDAGAGLQASAAVAYNGTDGLRILSTTGAIAATGGPAISADLVTLGLTLASASSTGSSSAGLSFTNVAGTANIASGALTSVVGGGAVISGGSASISYGGTITTVAQKSVSITGHSGTATFSGLVSGTGPNAGISVSSSTGTAHFSGGMSLTTTTGKAFSAVNGGTIAVTGSPNVLATTTATALEVTSGTQIGAAGLTFRSISSLGASSGIVLANTGTAGGLTVTGVGATATGGTIKSSTGAGVSLTNAANVSLSFVNIENGGDDGVFATGVDGFALTGCFVTNNGNAATEEGLQLDGVTGAISIVNTTVSGSAHNNAWLRNSSGTVSSLTVSGSTFSSPGATFGNAGLLIDLSGTAVINGGSVANSTFANNKATGLHLTAGGTSSVTALNITGATVTNNNIGIDLSKSQNASVTARVAGSTFLGQNSHALNIFTGAGATTSGLLKVRVENNVIGNAAVVESGSAVGAGIRTSINGNTAAQLLFDGNTIRQTPNGRGIEVVSRNGNGGTDATVTNNTINPDDTLGAPLAAIFLQSNAVTVPNRLRADVRGNVVPSGASADLLGAYIEIVESNGSTAELVDTAPPSADATAQLSSTNTGSVAAQSGVALIAGPINVP